MRLFGEAGIPDNTSSPDNAKGDDVIASREGKEATILSIEAKGSTSSRSGSARYGQPFESAALRVHFAEALFKSVLVLSRPDVNSRICAGIALPENSVYRKMAISVENIINQLGIIVFWVDDNGSASI